MTFDLVGESHRPVSNIHHSGVETWQGSGRYGITGDDRIV
jgi:hypothetical protein